MESQLNSVRERLGASENENKELIKKYTLLEKKLKKKSSISSHGSKIETLL